MEIEDSMLFWAFSPPPADPVDLNLQQEALLPLPPPPPTALVPRSSFVKYVRIQRRTGFEESCVSSNSRRKENVHKRVIEFLRKIPPRPPPPPKITVWTRGESSAGGGGSRCFRHMMRERQRRERLSQSYADLHSMVSPISKADKNSIVCASAAHLEDLRRAEAELRLQNRELREKAAGREAAGAQCAKTVNLRVGNPRSPIDSMLGALECLKAMGVRAQRVRSSFSGREMSAAIDVQTKMGSREVEEAVQSVLVDVEKQLRSGPVVVVVPPPTRAIGWCGVSHVRNTA